MGVGGMGRGNEEARREGKVKVNVSLPVRVNYYSVMHNLILAFSPSLFIAVHSAHPALTWRKTSSESFRVLGLHGFHGPKEWDLKPSH